MSHSPQKNVAPAVTDCILSASRPQWIRFSIVSILYVLFTIWNDCYWLLAGLILVFDIYISRIIPWDGWKRSKNRALRTIGDWADAIIFSLLAVHIVHIYILQMYQIPTSSLEKSLLVGDYLVVDKVTYGPRVPNTPLAFPLMHHTTPIFNTRSYSNWPLWDYHRLKGLRGIRRDDIVVFNFPTGDTVASKFQNQDYYDLVNRLGWERVNTDVHTFGRIISRPVDRRENYVKRCVGLPGDTLRIVDNQVLIDGRLSPLPKNAQFNYYVETHGDLLTEKQFKRLGVSREDQLLYNRMADAEAVFRYLEIPLNEAGHYNPVYRLPLTSDAHRLLQRSKWARTVRIEPEVFGGVTYPYHYQTGWTRDNFGPLWIPKKGETIVLNEENLALYARCITTYEGNTLHTTDSHVYLNGTPANSYTFRYDYYFMMGDNRHNSLDSRYWGFVPEDHIVGRPLLVLLSLDKDRGWFDGKIRWNRLFRSAKQ